jgi:hypothetical protein
LAIASATFWWSPEIIIIRDTPISCSRRSAVLAAARRIHQADRAQVAIPLRTTIVVRPFSRSSRSRPALLPQRRNALTSEHLGLADPHRRHRRSR